MELKHNKYIDYTKEIYDRINSLELYHISSRGMNQLNDIVNTSIWEDETLEEGLNKAYAHVLKYHKKFNPKVEERTYSLADMKRMFLVSRAKVNANYVFDSFDECLEII